MKIFKEKRNFRPLNKQGLIILSFLFFCSLITYFCNIFYFQDIPLVTTFNSLTSKEILFKYFYTPTLLMVAGIGLSVVGFSLQAINKNQLASPSMMGIYPITVFAFLILQITKNNSLITYLGFFLAILFCSILLLINYYFQTKNTGKFTEKPLLFGFGLGVVFSGINLVLASYVKNENISFVQLISNSVVYYSVDNFVISLVLITLSTVTLFIINKHINIMDIEFKYARVVGVRVNLIYFLVSLCAILISVSTVLSLGSISLIATIMPFFSRLIFKKQNYMIKNIGAGLIANIFLQLNGILVEFFLSINLVFLVASFLAIPLIFLVRYQIRRKFF
ncbi:iron chelate uptake ABC transporter family permease subunit [Ureaplasma canigenitalium]|uniref:iron chelate uptake ABC transporter family permease subunit n=1 Tax=Ureaplasma canigenitalium TaxID=42092 RepID=UPI0004E2508B|nr:iron chelate uptake ABC transporter family permease subunit [Ureaplasma canigenitalium]